MRGDHVDTVTHLISGPTIYSRARLAMTHRPTNLQDQKYSQGGSSVAFVGHAGPRSVRGVGRYFYHLRLGLGLSSHPLGPHSCFSLLACLPDQRLLMVFVSKYNLGGDFRIILRLLRLKVLLFSSSVLQLLNIKLSFNCCPNIRPSYSCSKKP